MKIAFVGVGMFYLLHAFKAKHLAYHVLAAWAPGVRVDLARFYMDIIRVSFEILILIPVGYSPWGYYR